eukprot:31387-Pelagococcus_subviridis.AAC.15
MHVCVFSHKKPRSPQVKKIRRSSASFLPPPEHGVLSLARRAILPGDARDAERDSASAPRAIVQRTNTLPYQHHGGNGLTFDSTTTRFSCETYPLILFRMIRFATTHSTSSRSISSHPSQCSARKNSASETWFAFAGYFAAQYACTLTNNVRIASSRRRSKTKNRVRYLHELVQAVLLQQRLRGELPERELDGDEILQRERLVLQMRPRALLERVRQVRLRLLEVVVEHREPSDVVRVRHALRLREPLERRERRQVHRVYEVFAQVQRVQLEVDLEEHHDEEQRRALLLLHARVGRVPVHEHEQRARVVEPLRFLLRGDRLRVRDVRELARVLHKSHQRVDRPRGVARPVVLHERLGRRLARHERVVAAVLRLGREALAVVREYLVVRRADLGRALRAEIEPRVGRDRALDRARGVREVHVEQPRERRAVVRVHRRGRGVEEVLQRRHDDRAPASPASARRAMRPREPLSRARQVYRGAVRKTTT